MDAIPLGKSLIPDIPCGFLMKDTKIGINNSREKTNKLAINRFLAIPDLQETAIAPIAEMTTSKPMQSNVSETSEYTDALFRGSKNIF